MKTSESGIEFIKGSRRLKLVAVLGSSDKLEIGFGHKQNTTPNQRILTRDAEVLLAYDLKVAEAILNESITVDLSQNQFDALISLIHDVGADKFTQSTLVKVINKNPNDLAIKAQFQRLLDYSKSAESLTLRQNEAKLYFKKR